MSDLAHPFYAFAQHGFVRVAAITPPVHLADPFENLTVHLARIHAAEAKGADLLVFPELSLTGYSLDDLHHQSVVQDQAEAALLALIEASKTFAPTVLVGIALRHFDRLYNCAAVVHGGELLGVVPKVFLPNYREFYEKRWFTSGGDVRDETLRIGDHEAPFGVDLIFRAENDADFSFGVEICEDVWSPEPPATKAALAGAHILCNLSASNVTIGKARDRTLLVKSQSMRLASAYVFAASGYGESTTDLAWDGQALVAELGAVLAEGPRFALNGAMVLADVDVERIRNERLRSPTFADAVARGGEAFRVVEFDRHTTLTDQGLLRPVPRFPFVPSDPALLDQDCFEAFNIQVQGLARRLEAAHAKTAIIGISGGLDSTHALLVTVKAFDLLGRPRSDIHGVTMPGFATSDGTKSDAWDLMRAFGISAREIDIRPMAETMLKDLDHPFGRGEPVYDLTFENVQAGLRTDYLFRLASHLGGLVVGTGDLSELGLGWCTYGVGDHMSHYGVNAGAPKTLIQHLIRWAARAGEVDEGAAKTLLSVVSREISPELIPGGTQSTEGSIGPYMLQDFNLFHITRFGLKPSKVAFLAYHAFSVPGAGGDWPRDFPEAAKRKVELPEIVKWLDLFLARFFGTSQYKRSALPNGPKLVSGGALSPRGDWRAPSDGTAKLWREELKAKLPF